MMYSWYSDAMKNYGQGRIVVNAITVEEARSKVRKYAKTYIIAGEPAVHDVIFIQGSE